MTRADAGAVVAVEVFVKQDVVPPVRVGLKLFSTAVDGPPAVFVAQEDSDQPSAEISWATSKRFISLPEPVGTFHPEIIAVVLIQVQERPNNEDS